MTTKAKVTKVKNNPAGFWRGGLWHPIRKPKFVGQNKRQATLFDKQQYDPDKAGDNDDVFDREIRKERNKQKAVENFQRMEERAIEREMSGGDYGKKAQRLHQFVRSSGGIRWDDYDKGELRDFTFKQSGKKGIAFGKGKKTLDRMRESAAEAGYLSMSSDVNEFLDLLSKDMKGRAVYPNRSNPAPKRRKPAKRAAIARKPARRNPQPADKLQTVFEGTLRIGFKHQKLLPIGKQYEGNLEIAANKGLCSIKRQDGKIYAVKTADNPRQTATRRKNFKPRKNPATATPAELAKLSIATFDLNGDGVVNNSDVAAIKKATIKPIRVKHRNTGETGELLGANDDGELFVNFSNDVRTVDAENVIFLNFPETRMNPAQVIGKAGNYRVKLHSGKIHSDFAGKPVKFRTKPAAERFVESLNLSGADELSWINSLEYGQKRLVRTNPGLNPITAFATGAGALLNVLAIKDRLTGTPKKRRAKRAVSTRTNPSTFAQRERKNIDAMKKARETWNQYLSDVETPAFHKLPFKQKSAQMKAAMKAAQKLGINSIAAQSKIAERQTNFLYGRRNPATKARKNPTIPHRPNFQMFNGRPATNAKYLPASHLAPKNGDQCGILIEIRLSNGAIYRPGELSKNPYRLVMSGRDRRLWIVGAKWDTPSVPLTGDKLEVLGEWSEVIYETSKPHIEGDDNDYHYLHPLGEDTGERPLFCIDRRGFAVIMNGAYTVEDRGIVN